MEYDELVMEDFNIDQWKYKYQWFEDSVSDMRRVITSDRELTADVKTGLLESLTEVRRAMDAVERQYLSEIRQAIQRSKERSAERVAKEEAE